MEVFRQVHMYESAGPNWIVGIKTFESTTHVLFPTIKPHVLIAGKTHEITGIINTSQEESYISYNFLQSLTTPFEKISLNGLNGARMHLLTNQGFVETDWVITPVIRFNKLRLNPSLSNDLFLKNSNTLDNRNLNKVTCQVTCLATIIVGRRMPNNKGLITSKLSIGWIIGGNIASNDLLHQRDGESIPLIITI